MSDFHKLLDDTPDFQTTSALALVLYACQEVHQLAQGGVANPQTIQGYAEPTLITAPDTFSELMPALPTLHLALKTLTELLQGKPSLQVDANQAQLALRQTIIYSQGIFKLHKLLLRDPQAMQLLENRLHIIARFKELQAIQTQGYNQQVIQKMASLYLDVFGQMKFRILVQGQTEALREPARVEHIRCLLLGAIRFAMLWQQVGGRPWHFIFQRRKILKNALLLQEKIQRALQRSQDNVVKIKP